ncbi:hypothetical protein J6590_092199, partial [Homalodisca vitripennis]
MLAYVPYDASFSCTAGKLGIAGNEEADLLHKKEIRPHLFVLSHSAELAVPRL